MFNGRGRGKAPEWIYLERPQMLKCERDICVGRRRKLSIVHTSSKGRGVSVNVVLKCIGSDICNLERQSPPLKCSKLLFDCFLVAPQHVNSLNDLSSRILKNIFSYIQDVRTLLSCEMVCKRWKCLLSDVAVNPIYFNPTLKRKRVYVRRVYVGITKNVAALQCVFEKSKKKPNALFSIRWYLPTKFANVAYVLGFVRSIFAKFIITSTLSFEQFDITPNLLALVVAHQPHIEGLRFLRSNVHRNALETLKPLGSLRLFAVDHCTGHVDAFSSRVILRLVKSNSLYNLELCGVSTLAKIDDSVVDAVVDKWKWQKLQFLKLTNCPMITTAAVIKLVTQHANSSNGNRLVVFLDNTGFDSSEFLAKLKYFKMDDKSSTKRMVLIKSPSTYIWISVRKEV